MKSKIEKLDHIDCITYKNRAILEGDITIVTEETVSKILRKQNEIIDYLNSQSQPEEKGWKTATAYTGDPIEETTTTSSKDTPEEKEEFFERGE